MRIFASALLLIAAEPARADAHALPPTEQTPAPQSPADEPNRTFDIVCFLSGGAESNLWVISGPRDAATETGERLFDADNLMILDQAVSDVGTAFVRFRVPVEIADRAGAILAEARSGGVIVSPPPMPNGFCPTGAIERWRNGGPAPILGVFGTAEEMARVRTGWPTRPARLADGRLGIRFSPTDGVGRSREDELDDYADFLSQVRANDFLGIDIALLRDAESGRRPAGEVEAEAENSAEAAAPPTPEYAQHFIELLAARGELSFFVGADPYRSGLYRRYSRHRIVAATAPSPCETVFVLGELVDHGLGRDTAAERRIDWRRVFSVAPALASVGLNTSLFPDWTITAVETQSNGASRRLGEAMEVLRAACDTTAGTGF